MVVSCLLAVLMIPLHFTAPADSAGPVVGVVRSSPEAVRAYTFHRLDADGVMTAIPRFADSAATTILEPHAPGTPETVWLPSGMNAGGVTIYVMSRDANGNLSAPSNGCVIGHHAAPARPALRRGGRNPRGVAVITKQREAGATRRLAQRSSAREGDHDHE